MSKIQSGLERLRTLKEKSNKMDGRAEVYKLDFLDTGGVCIRYRTPAGKQGYDKVPRPDIWDTSNDLVALYEYLGLDDVELQEAHRVPVVTNDSGQISHLDYDAMR